MPKLARRRATDRVESPTLLFADGDGRDDDPSHDDPPSSAVKSATSSTRRVTWAPYDSLNRPVDMMHSDPDQQVADSIDGAIRCISAMFVSPRPRYDA